MKKASCARFRYEITATLNKPLSSGKYRRHPCRCDQKDLNHRAASACSAFVFQFQYLRQPMIGRAVNVIFRQETIRS